MQRLAERSSGHRGSRRRDIRVDGVLPVADARERVRGHVQRVRHRRRDRRVAAGGVECARRESRDVVGVNDVVRVPRMLGICRKESVEDVRRLELLAYVLSVGQRRLADGEGVERRRLAVIRVLLGHLLHAPLVGEDAGPLIHGRVVLVQLGYRRDVAQFARRRRFRRPGSRDGRLSFRERLRRPDSGKRVAPMRHRDAPVRHRTGWILGQHALKGLLRRGKRERVEQRHRAVEGGADLSPARGREVHASELLRRRVLVLRRTLRTPGRRCDENDKNDNDGRERAHP